MKRRRSLLICLAILGFLFLACNGEETATEEPEASPPPEATATATPEYLWTVVAPPGGTHGLWPKDCLEDDTSPLCVAIADLPDGTLLRPGPEGCVTATWAETWEDSENYIYCHVQVASGGYEGEWGWVSEGVIEK